MASTAAPPDALLGPRRVLILERSNLEQAVHGHGLRDCLKSLTDLGLIAGFTVGRRDVEVEVEHGSRFELLLHINELIAEHEVDYEDLESGEK